MNDLKCVGERIFNDDFTPSSTGESNTVIDLILFNAHNFFFGSSFYLSTDLNGYIRLIFQEI